MSKTRTRGILKWFMYLLCVFEAIFLLWPGSHLSFRQWLITPLSKNPGGSALMFQGFYALCFFFDPQRLKGNSYGQRFALMLSYMLLAVFAMTNDLTGMCASLPCRLFIGVSIRALYLFCSLTVAYLFVFRTPSRPCLSKSERDSLLRAFKGSVWHHLVSPFAARGAEEEKAEGDYAYKKVPEGDES
jgi:hypothetical protein